MSRHYSSRSYGGYGSSRRRTGADRFGILTFFLLLISSGFLAARLLTTGVLTQKLTLLLLAVLAGLNVLFAVTQLPRWRNKLWKLVLGLVALVLSAGMIYATVATNAVLETLSRVSSTGSVKTAYQGSPAAAPVPARASRATSVAVSKPSPNSTPRFLTMESETTTKVASRKKTTSINGMISMRARRRGAAVNFMARPRDGDRASALRGALPHPQSHAAPPPGAR